MIGETCIIITFMVLLPSLVMAAAVRMRSRRHREVRSIRYVRMAPEDEWELCNTSPQEIVRKTREKVEREWMGVLYEAAAKECPYPVVAHVARLEEGTVQRTPGASACGGDWKGRIEMDWSGRIDKIEARIREQEQGPTLCGRPEPPKEIRERGRSIEPTDTIRQLQESHDRITEILFGPPPVIMGPHLTLRPPDPDRTPK